MNNLNPNNGNETKSETFPLDIFKSDAMQNIKVFVLLSKSKFLSFTTKARP